MKRLLWRFVPNVKGQGMIEYAVTLAGVLIVVIVILTLIGPRIEGIFSNVIDAFSPNADLVITVDPVSTDWATILPTDSPVRTPTDSPHIHTSVPDLQPTIDLDNGNLD